MDTCDDGEAASLEEALEDALEDLLVEDVLLPDDLDGDAAATGSSSVPATWNRRRVLEEASSVSAAQAATWSAGLWFPCHTLEAPFARLLARLTPGSVEHARRSETMSVLTTSVERRFRGRLAVALFGSQVSGFCLRDSDLDVTLQLPHGTDFWAGLEALGGEQHEEEQARRKAKVLRQLLHSPLGAHSHVAATQLIPKARVPVLKVETVTGLRVDISVASDGVFKSTCLGLLGDMQPLFRSLVRVVKAWARAHGLNDAASGTLNSFALSTLALFHCQTGLPSPLLPPVAHLLSDDADAVVLQERTRAAACSVQPSPGRLAVDADRDLGAARRRAEGLTARGFSNDMAAQLTLPSLTASFFAHFYAMLPLLEQGACPQPFSGIWGPPGPWRARKRLGFCIEDPFDAYENPARSTEHSIVFGRMAACVADTAAALATELPPGDVGALHALAARVFGDPSAFDQWQPGQPPSMRAPMSPLGGRGGGQGRRHPGGRGGQRAPSTPRSQGRGPGIGAASLQGPGDSTPTRTLPAPRLPLPRPLLGGEHGPGTPNGGAVGLAPATMPAPQAAIPAPRTPAADTQQQQLTPGTGTRTPGQQRMRKNKGGGGVAPEWLPDL